MISSGSLSLSRSYGYNARGEVTSDGSFGFTRNDAGQITVVSGVGSFAYDGNSKRIKTVLNGTTEYHLYNLGGRLIQTYLPATSQRSDYFTLQGKTIVQIDKTGSGSDVPTYFAVDLLGSPVTATNASGTVLWHERYGPYGEKLEDQDSTLGYTGHEHDYETGLTYAQARFYDGQVGRFIETDPVHFTGEPFSFNRYAYANNNPYKYKDPSGASVTCADVGNCNDQGGFKSEGQEPEIIGAMAGAAAGAATAIITKNIATGVRVGKEVAKTVEKVATERAAAEKASGNVTKEVLTRKAAGRDGAASEQTITREDGTVTSRTHTVTSTEGNVVHQHENFIGKAGGERQFPDEWTGTQTINAPYDNIPPPP